MRNTFLFTTLLAPRLWAKLTIAGIFCTGSLLTGIVPTISWPQPGLNLTSAAYAQAVDPQQITQYARAALKIEQIRQRAYADAKRILSGSVPLDVCRQANIPQSVQAICTDFLDKSEGIIRGSGLTVPQFNEITRLRKSNPEVQQQIQNELIKVQGTP